MNILQRDIVLVPFPFSDLSGKKVRPAFVLSNNQFNEFSDDIIVCVITSNITREPYTITIMTKDLAQGRLFESCSIKVESIFKIDKRLIVKNIGALKEEVFANVLKKLNALF